MTSRDDAHDKALDHLADVHRGWCNYCQGDALTCLNAPEGGCSLRDYMIALDAIRRSPPSSEAVATLIAQCRRILEAQNDNIVMQGYLNCLPELIDAIASSQPSSKEKK